MRSVALGVPLFALAACGPDAPAEPVTEGACPITAPVRLAAAPDGFVAADDTWYGVHVFGDDILFTFDRFDAPDRVYWRLDRCTGDIERYDSLAPGLHNPRLIDAADGRVLYGNDGDHRPFVLDRLDVPGADEPRPVPGLPDGAQLWSSDGDRYATFARFGPSSSNVWSAAGLGGRTWAMYTHHGDPDVPALPLSERIVRAYYFDDTHDLVHEDSGEVFLIDEATGERELVLAGVRYLEHGFDGRTFIWQAIGDDISEPVFLRDIATGVDIQIAVNDFAGQSWHRDPDSSDLGEWISPRGSGAAAMIGPGARYVAAVRTDTGEPVVIPPHAGQRGAFADQFVLTLAGDAEEILALWDPLSGVVREWYRGPAKHPELRAVDGDIVEYFVSGDDGAGSLWRADLATGEAVELLADVGAWPYLLDDDRYLVSVTHARLDGPPTSSGGHLAPRLREYRVVDLATGVTTPIVDRVAGVASVPHEGLVYIDAFGPEPGVWAYPLPGLR